MKMNIERFEEIMAEMEIDDYCNKRFKNETTTIQDMVDFLYLLLWKSDLPMESLITEDAPDNSVYIQTTNGCKYRINVQETDKFI